MVFMKINFRFDMPHHGPLQHLFKDAEVAVDSLTHNHDAMVKCLYVVNRSGIQKKFQVSPEDSNLVSL
jgi:hypothetical protein